jgi:hypothetical protein
MNTNQLRAVIKGMLLEVKAGLIRQQAQRGDIAPAAQQLVKKLQIQLSTAGERREDPAWQKNTKALVVPLAQFVANQAAMIHWASLLDEVPDEQEAPELSDIDSQFHDKVRQHVEGLLADMIKRASSGEQVDGAEVEQTLARVMANVKKTHQVSPSPKLKPQMAKTPDAAE